MKTITVIGLGQFGSHIATSLTQKGFEVIAIDTNPEIVADMKEMVHHAIIADSTEEKAMRALNIDNVNIAIVSIGSNVQSSLLTTALLQRMNIENIYVRAINSLQERILKSMGITSVINIEKDMGIQLANTLSSVGIGRYIEISNRHSLLELNVPAALVGKSIKTLNLREKYSVNVVGIKTRIPNVNSEGDIYYEEHMADVPDPDYLLGKDDLLVIVGTDHHLSKFIKLGQTDE